MKSDSAPFVRNGTPAILATLLLSACAHGPTRHAGCDAAAAATIPMWLNGSHASVEVRINGRPARMLLDTGADQVVLSPLAAARLGLHGQTDSTPGFGAAGSISASKTSIADLSVGGFHQRRQAAYVVPFPQEFGYDGVLGTPFFAAFITTMDYQRRLFTLEPHSACETHRGAASIPIRVESGKLLLLATAGGVSGWFSADTGAGNALTFFAPIAERLRLRDTFSPAIRTVTGVSPGGYTHGALVRLPSVGIGPYVFDQVVAELSIDTEGYFAKAPYIGNLGGELWRRFNVTLDYPNGLMYLTPNDAFKDPFVGPRSGLTPSLVGGVVRVIDVVEDGPAAAAGVRVGDAILAVDGTILSTQGADGARSIDTVVRSLRAAPGTPVSLRLLDASGVEREAGLVLRDLL